MKKQNCIMRKRNKIMLGAICFFTSFLIFADAVPERYNVIVSRAPFGPIKNMSQDASNASVELTPEQIKLQEELAKEADLLGKNIKLTAITYYQGLPAAGIVEISSKRTYYLTKGQSILGYTLTDIGDNSILLETTNAIANITMSYAPGQPSEIVVHPTSGRLSVLNIFDQSVAATNSVVVKQQASLDDENSSNQIDGLNLSKEMREAVTIKDSDGVERISFRELHKLRMEERKRKLEEERIAREAKERAEQEARQEEARRQAELDSILEAEEKLVEASETAAVQTDIGVPQINLDDTSENFPDAEMSGEQEVIIFDFTSDNAF